MTLGQIGLGLVIASTLSSIIWASSKIGRVATWCSAGLATATMTLLASAFLRQQWEYEYVADNARSGVGPVLRMAGSWAGAEGSLLLWTMMVAWAAVVAASISPEPGTVRLGALATGGYALVNLFLASPFHRLDVPPVNGLGLQPILEHPAMVWHPPILYAGLAGLLPAAFITGGRSGIALPAKLFAIPLAILATGLLTGARWAHVELGWGGYWAWDPIETAGLVAWLAGAAALHIHKTAKPVVFILPGIAAIWATTLTRIGVIESVHAFANRAGLRTGLLLVAFGLTAALLYSSRSSPTSQDLTAPRLLTAHRSLAAIVLGLACFLAAVGTYEPLVEAATRGNRVAIAGTFFSKMLWPVSVIGVALAVRADRRWWPAIGGGLLAVLATPPSAGLAGLILAVAGGSLVGTSVAMLAKHRPGAIAHLGVGLLLVGIAGTVASSSGSAWIENEQTSRIAGLDITHQNLEHGTAPGQSFVQANARIDGESATARLVRFEQRGVTTSEMSNQFRGLDEVQLILLDGDDGGARYRLNRLPRLGLVWIGGAVLVLGLLWPNPSRSRSDRVHSAETQ